MSWLDNNKQVLKSVLIIMLTIIVAILLGLTINISNKQVMPIILDKEDSTIQIVGVDDSVIHYQKTTFHSPFEVVLNFSCDRQTGEIINYTANTINYDTRLISPVEANIMTVVTDKNGDDTILIYNYYLDIHVTQETAEDFKLLESYGYIEEEGIKEAKISFKKGFVDCFIGTPTEHIKEVLPNID